MPKDLSINDSYAAPDPEYVSKPRKPTTSLVKPSTYVVPSLPWVKSRWDDITPDHTAAMGYDNDSRSKDTDASQS